MKKVLEYLEEDQKVRLMYLIRGIRHDPGSDGRITDVRAARMRDTRLERPMGHSARPNFPVTVRRSPEGTRADETNSWLSRGCKLKAR